MPLFRIQLSAAAPRGRCVVDVRYTKSRTSTVSLLNSKIFFDNSARNSGRRLFWHSAESNPHTASIGSHSVTRSQSRSSGMSSSAPSGSFGRVFGLHGNGSEDSSKEDEEEDAVEEDEDEADEAEESAAIMSCGCMFRTSDTDSRSTVLSSAHSVATAVTIALLRITKRTSSFLESVAISCVCIFMRAAPDRVWKEFFLLDGAIVIVGDESASWI